MSNTYFRQLPILDYPSLANDRQSSYDYLKVRNIFKRGVLRQDVLDNYVGFDLYAIEDGYIEKIKIDYKGYGNTLYLRLNDVKSKLEVA